ncbi:MAG: ABC transporter permease [Myxococcales bacterium]|nr:ABC transporter permease [Myxococcales bacterium]
MRLLLLALRNLSRNKRRSIITALAVLFGCAAIVALQGINNGFVANLIETTVESRHGAVQVFRKGHIGSNDPLKLSLPQDAELVRRIEAVPGVLAVAPRLSFDGMVNNGSESTMFMAMAIDPEREYKVCPKRLTRVSPGSQPLRPGKEGDALIGKTLAEALGADKGATLVMQAAGPHASTNALDVEISGFLPTQSVAESKRMATVRLRFAQDLLRMPNQVSQYVVGIAHLDQADAVAASLRQALGSEYDVTTWADLDPATKTRVGSVLYVMLFVGGVLFLLVATGIVNTMLMSVFERVREIGTMLALGVRRWQVTVLFLAEALFLGLFASTLGVILGYGIVAGVFRKGFTIRPPGGDVTTIYPHIDLSYLLLVVGFALVGTMLAALYPAWKAARLRPVDALRAN